MLKYLILNYISYCVYLVSRFLNGFINKCSFPLTIAFIHGDSDVIAGSELALLDLILGMRHTVCNPIVVTRREGPYTELLRKHKIRVNIIKLSRLDRSNPFPFVKTVLNLAVFLIKNRVSLIHVNNMLPFQYSLIAARLAGIPSICHVRSTIYTSYDLHSSLALYADKLVVVTEGVRRALIKLGVPEEKLAVIRDGIYVNPQGKNPQPGISFRLEFGIGDGVPIVGQFGQIIERKGVSCFLDMARIIHERIEDIRFVLVGSQMYDDGLYYKAMLEYCRKTGMADKVIFTGFRNDTRKIMSEADIHVLASSAEGGALVLMEAAAEGKPVVASDIPGINDIVSDGVTGFLVAKREPAEFAERVMRLLENRELAQTFGKNAKSLATEKFSIEKSAHEIGNLYLQLIYSLSPDKLELTAMEADYRV